MKAAIERLKNDQASSPIHQLAVITCIRKELSKADVDSQQFLEAMHSTSILEVVDTILNFEGATEE